MNNTEGYLHYNLFNFTISDKKYEMPLIFTITVDNGYNSELLLFFVHIEIFEYQKRQYI